MNKLTKVIVFPLVALSLSGCALFEMAENEQYNVDLGNGDNYIKWNLVENNNEYHAVTSAYFEFSKDNFRYYEDGSLKKEGKSSVKYFGLEDPTTQMTIRLNTTDTVYDDGRLYCFTEDDKDDLHQFTVWQMGYQIKPVRTGGVPVRDYHLSEMPFAFGTYVKEGSERYNYKHKRLSAEFNGSFVDESGNKFYFVNNSYKNDSGASYDSCMMYFRYENNVNHIFIEGTISTTEYDDWELGKRKAALLYVMHGQSEPSKEKGVAEFPDYELKDFYLDVTTNSLSFTSANYFDDQECSYSPATFIAGTYTKVVA